MMEKKAVREQMPIKRRRRNLKTTSIEFTSSELIVLISAIGRSNSSPLNHKLNRVNEKLRNAFLDIEINK